MATPVGPRVGTAPDRTAHRTDADADRRLDPGDWVWAQPFRSHLRHLMAATGLPWRALSRLAGAPPDEVRRLLQGTGDGRPVRKIRLDLARRLYALSPDSILLARRTMTRVDQSAAGLERLLAAGWTITELSGRLRLAAVVLSAIAERRRPVCSRLVEARILAAAQTLGSASDYASPTRVARPLRPTVTATDETGPAARAVLDEAA